MDTEYSKRKHMCRRRNTPDQKKRYTVGKQLGLLRRKKQRIIHKLKRKDGDVSFLNALLKTVNEGIACVEQNIKERTTSEHVIHVC